MNRTSISWLWARRLPVTRLSSCALVRSKSFKNRTFNSKLSCKMRSKTLRKSRPNSRGSSCIMSLDSRCVNRKRIELRRRGSVKRRSWLQEDLPCTLKMLMCLEWKWRIKRCLLSSILRSNGIKKIKWGKFTSQSSTTKNVKMLRELRLSTLKPKCTSSSRRWRLWLTTNLSGTHRRTWKSATNKWKTASERWIMFRSGLEFQISSLS